MTNRVPAERVHSRAELCAAGWTGYRITTAVRTGALRRLRRDHYVFDADDHADEAVRIGGRVTCVSLLARFGVFVFDDSSLHVRVPLHASRLRRTGQPGRTSPGGAVLHWRDEWEPAGSRHLVDLAEAVRDVIVCQEPRHVVATLDSIRHLRLMTHDELATVFGTLPDRYRVLLDLVEPQCETGTESLLRLMLRQLGADVAVQVSIDTVGRVDFVVDGWLIIECDSKGYHEGWEKQRSDRRRDLAAAALGYTTIRPLAEDILYHSGHVKAALAAILRAHGTRG